MILFKIALIGIGGALLAAVVRQFQKEYSVFVLLGVCLFLSLYLVSNLTVMIDFVEELSTRIPISQASCHRLYLSDFLGNL